MLLTLALTFFVPFAQSVPPRPHIPISQLTDIAIILAHDEGWPLGNPDYTLDPMRPVDDDGFDSIGVYNKAHLVRMYSIDRTTGQIVDFMRGCQIFRFKDLESFQQTIQRQSHASPLTNEQLARKAGCPKLTVINTQWVKDQ